MFSIGYAIWLFAFCTTLAILEIQIEGKYGWAKNLPCWRSEPDSLLAKIQTGKPLTGYHLAFNLCELVILHMPFFVGMRWNLANELETIAAIFLVWVFEDFLWFLWNPFYGLKKFNSKSIEWHKKWLGPVPLDYWTGFISGAAVIFLASLLEGKDVFKRWFVVLLILLCFTIISCCFVPLFTKRKTEGE